MKRKLSLLLAMLLCLTLSACIHVPVSGRVNGKVHIRETSWGGYRGMLHEIVRIGEIKEDRLAGGYRLVHCNVIYSSDPDHAYPGSFYIQETMLPELKPGEVYLFEFFCRTETEPPRITQEHAAIFRDGAIDLSDSFMMGLNVLNSEARVCREHPEDWMPPIPAGEIVDGSTVEETAQFISSMHAVYLAWLDHADVFIPGEENTDLRRTVAVVVMLSVLALGVGLVWRKRERPPKR